MNQDFVSSTEQLADGFSALCDEYKLLAQQYSVLENKLSVATLEVGPDFPLPSEKHPFHCDENQVSSRSVAQEVLTEIKKICFNF